MPRVSSNHLRESGKPPSASSVRPSNTSRPGWSEIIVGLIVYLIIGFGGVSLFKQLGLDPVVHGLILTAWTGVATLIAFTAAARLRIRSLSAFGVRRTSSRWLLTSVGVGLVAFVIKGLAIMVWIQITGDTDNVQDVYAEGGRGGLLSLVLSTVFISVFSPFGEELLYRGIVTNALLRYGSFVGVVGSTLIFALMHGINIVFPAAIVAGLATAEVFRRSGSIWPGLVVHIVFNLPTIPVMVFVGMG
ncbi:CPBP family intramembrane metalloprotease [Calothrix sp. FACHB-1219]|uniref:CPBP family intramembrane glutamic endopeptidase n=1 Tax=unclassified Calothrix TaxID=2619626 RepID=UPI001688573C|nr:MULTISPECIES: type II CAAX endopeptidase family protein [unclassified Calothrix]MBD2207986.1 CPBP family intramembrane metalloprotease [Calothrix sp. FACHB-168]MBD2222539.1 CPBP family intramembrane metalloprotease [Calothrix sp. FACHB-1219]